MSTIAISFTSSATTVYNFVLDKFIEDNLPRSYAESNNFSFSVSGSAILTGTAYNQRHIWAVSTVLTNAVAASFDDMYKDWDADRAEGLAVALGVIDSTFGTSITTNAIFSTSPRYQKFGPSMMIASFGLTEI